MATATTPEHVEAHTAPVAERPLRAEVRKVNIDGSTLAVLGVGIALFTMAFGAFTHLSGRIDGLDSKIERVATDLRTDIKDVNAKVDRLGTEMNAKVDKLSAEMNAKLDRLNAETNDKFDRLNEKITQILINQSQGK